MSLQNYKYFPSYMSYIRQFSNNYPLAIAYIAIAGGVVSYNFLGSYKHEYTHIQDKPTIVFFCIQHGVSQPCRV